MWDKKEKNLIGLAIAFALASIFVAALTLNQVANNIHTTLLDIGFSFSLVSAIALPVFAYLIKREGLKIWLVILVISLIVFAIVSIGLGAAGYEEAPKVVIIKK